MNNNNAGLEYYSLGMVAVDKLEDDNYIKVYPIEILPTVTGDPVDSKDIGITSTTNPFGEIKNSPLTKTNLITAKWLPRGNPNRASAPDVMKGETVYLYRYGGSDKYFWESMYCENDLRKNEKVIYLYSNKKEIGPIDKNYYFTIDTKNKFIRLHTDDSDGEYTAYDIDLDTRNGVLTIQDGKKNEITLTSKDDKLLIKTNKTIEITTTDHITNNTTTTNNISKNKKETIGERSSILLKKLDISNGKDEIISLLTELIDAIMDEVHIDSDGSSTRMSSGSTAKFSDIKSRFEEFM